MDNDDIVQIQDLAAVRTSVVLARRKVLGTAVATPLLAALLVFLAAYYFSSVGIAASLFLAAVFVLIGVLVLVHWLRHYKSILQQLDVLDRRVSSGETVYGSQVAFHSYR